MQRAANSLMLVIIGFSAAVCLAVLVKIGAYAEEIKGSLTPEPVIIDAPRGRIFDRYGHLLAGTDENGNRYYPAKLCSHLLGTLSADGSAQSGIELAFDEELSGRPGYTNGLETQPPVRGADVYLTIDSKLQSAAEKILSTAARRYDEGVRYETDAPYSGSAGAIVVLGCRRGEVLASASYPDFSPGTFSEDYSRLLADERFPLLDRVTNGLYRPGSTLKTVTAAAALYKGAIGADTSFWCGGHLYLGGSDFTCMNTHGYTDVRRALEVSCNLFFYRAALALGIDRLVEYEKLFGLGKAPDYELPTLAGQLASPETLDYWSSGQLVQAAIGQSVTEVTPLQMAGAALMLADRGRSYSPSVVMGVGSRSGRSLEKEPQTELPDCGVFDIIKDGMVSSTKYTYGEFALSQLDKPAAIKTGTPQSPRGYDSAVIGFYPADRPEIAFAVMLEGGANAKHTVYEIIKAYTEQQPS